MIAHGVSRVSHVAHVKYRMNESLDMYERVM